MENSDLVTIGLVLAGACIMLFAIFQTRIIFRLVEDKRYKRGWRNLYILVSFFLMAYFIAAYIVYIGESSLLQLLTGVIFFLGAIFVFVVVLMGAGTFRQLKSSNVTLLEKLGLLRLQNDQLTQFSHATSHDLKEPINTVMNSISFVKSRYSEVLDETGINFLDYTLSASDRMTEMVNGLSDFMLVGSEGERELTDIGLLIRNVLDSMHGSIESAKASVTVTQMPALQVNQKELKRVFQNLIANAVKYRKKDIQSSIHVSSRQIEENAWEFQVKDNGIGIKEEDFDKVFQLFRQLNKEQYEGMGVGLAVTKKAVEMHGGEIWLESKEGEGTTFFFTIKN